eukprot:PRCOL_00003766-RA
MQLEDMERQTAACANGIDAAEATELLRDDLVPAAVEYLESVLDVREPVPEGTPLHIQYSCRTVASTGDCIDWSATPAPGAKCFAATYDTAHFPERTTYRLLDNGQLGAEPRVEPGGPGLYNTDIVVYVTARDTGICGGSIAQAGMCAQDPVTDRPVAGNINFCPCELKTRSMVDAGEGGMHSGVWAEERRLQVGTTVHELVHVLGISANLFPYWRDANNGGAPRVERNAFGQPLENDAAALSTLGRVEVRDSVPVLRSLATPALVAAARAQTSCAEVTEVELEDEGGAGSALSHFEMKHYYGELMTAQGDRVQLLTGMSAGALEDSGWYVVDDAVKEAKMNYGLGAGCALFEDSLCNQPTHFPEFLCDSSTLDFDFDVPQDLVNAAQRPSPGHKMSRFACTPDGLAVGVCGEGNQEGFLGGCRRVVEYSNWFCPHAQGMGKMWGESYGADSRCFESTLWLKVDRQKMTVSSNVAPLGAGCFRRRCDAEGNLDVLINGAWQRCASDGQELRDPGFEGGYVRCPSDVAAYCAHSVCPDECHLNGACVSGACECYPGYGGVNCATSFHGEPSSPPPPAKPPAPGGRSVGDGGDDGADETSDGILPFIRDNLVLILAFSGGLLLLIACWYTYTHCRHARTALRMANAEARVQLQPLASLQRQHQQRETMQQANGFGAGGVRVGNGGPPASTTFNNAVFVSATSAERAIAAQIEAMARYR